MTPPPIRACLAVLAVAAGAQAQLQDLQLRQQGRLSEGHAVGGGLLPSPADPERAQRPQLPRQSMS